MVLEKNSELYHALEFFGFEEFRSAYEQLRILEVLESALKRNEYDANTLRTKYGLLREHILFLYQLFPNLKYNKKPSTAEIKQKIKELQNTLAEAKSKLLKSMEIWIFPRWRNLIGAVYLGMFEGRPIRDISWSAVAILVPSIDDVRLYRLLTGDEVIGIFGIGSYIVQFFPEKANKPVLYHLPIHGVIIERKIYENALESKKMILAPKYSDYFKEHLWRIPLDVLGKSKLAIRFFAPILRKNYQILRAFMETVKAFQRSISLDDIAILSAWRGAFNKLLITSQKFDSMSIDLIKGIPGIVGYEGLLNRLEELPIVSDTDVYERKMHLSWLRFAITGFNLIEQFSA